MARPRRWPLRAGLFLVAVLVAVVVTLPITLPATFRTRLVAALSERFNSQVELKTLRISLLPRLRVVGDVVVLRHKGRVDVPPLITIQSFSADANLLGLIRRQVHLRHLRLEGLEINVPPGGMDIDDDDKDTDKGEPRPETREQPRGDRAAEPPPATRERRAPVKESPLVIDDLVCERAVLRILRRRPDKQPRVFEIDHLSMQDAGSNDPWAFTAGLTNPTPPGEIKTSGTFGPWNAEEPSSTPLDAKYVFSKADLGVFDGIRGTLDSTGAFSGVLERIEVDGRADVPGVWARGRREPGSAPDAVPFDRRWHERQHLAETGRRETPGDRHRGQRRRGQA